MTQRYKFGSRQRLKRKADFDRVFGRRCSAGGDGLVVYVDANELGFCRLGLVVGRRVGNAVRRNRVKRAIREAFRLAQHDLPPGFDIVCVAKPTPNAEQTNPAADFAALTVRAAERFKRLRTPINR